MSRPQVLATLRPDGLVVDELTCAAFEAACDSGLSKKDFAQAVRLLVTVVGERFAQLSPGAARPSRTRSLHPATAVLLAEAAATSSFVKLSNVTEEELVGEAKRLRKIGFGGLDTVITRGHVLPGSDPVASLRLVLDNAPEARRLLGTRARSGTTPPGSSGTQAGASSSGTQAGASSGSSPPGTTPSGTTPPGTTPPIDHLALLRTELGAPADSDVADFVRTALTTAHTQGDAAGRAAAAAEHLALLRTELGAPADADVAESVRTALLSAHAAGRAAVAAEDRAAGEHAAMVRVRATARLGEDADALLALSTLADTRDAYATLSADVRAAVAADPALGDADVAQAVRDIVNDKAALQVMHGHLEEANKTLEDKLATLNKRVQSAESAGTELAALRAWNARLQEENGTADADNRRLRQTQRTPADDTLVADLAAAREKIAALEGAPPAVDPNVARLEREVVNLQTSNATLTTTNTSLQTRNASLQTRNTSLETRNATLVATVQRLETDSANARDARDAYDNALAPIRQQFPRVSDVDLGQACRIAVRNASDSVALAANDRSRQALGLPDPEAGRCYRDDTLHRRMALLPAVLGELSLDIWASLDEVRDAFQTLRDGGTRTRTDYEAQINGLKNQLSEGVAGVRREANAAHTRQCAEDKTARDGIEKKHKDAVKVLEKRHADAVAARAKEHKDAVDARAKEYTDAIAALEKRHSDAVAALETKHTSALETAAKKLEDTHAAAIDKLKAEHKAAVAALETKHTSALEARDQGHANATNTLETGHRDAVAALETKLATAGTDLAQSKARVAILTTHAETHAASARLVAQRETLVAQRETAVAQRETAVAQREREAVAAINKARDDKESLEQVVADLEERESGLADRVEAVGEREEAIEASTEALSQQHADLEAARELLRTREDALDDTTEWEEAVKKLQKQVRELRDRRYERQLEIRTVARPLIGDDVDTMATSATIDLLGTRIAEMREGHADELVAQHATIMLAIGVQSLIVNRGALPDAEATIRRCVDGRISPAEACARLEGLLRQVTCPASLWALLGQDEPYSAEYATHAGTVADVLFDNPLSDQRHDAALTVVARLAIARALDMDTQFLRDQLLDVLESMV